jgi:two-component system, NarL family, sensor histidine kinase DegS
MKQLLTSLDIFPPRVSLDKAIRTSANPYLWVLLIMVIAISIPYYYDFMSFGHRLDWIWQFRIIEYIYHINGSLLYLPIIYSAIIFGWTLTLYLWIILLIVLLPRVIYYTGSFTALFNNILFLMVPILAMSVVILILKWVHREQQIFSDREAERQAFMAQVLRAQENERKNVAHELHDGTIQTLFALSNNVQSLLENSEEKLSATAIGQLESFRDTASSASEDLRRLCVKLRPSILDNIGLIEALRWLVDNINGENIRAGIVINNNDWKLDNDTEVIIFRFVQEALNNVRRHSGATKVTVEINYTPGVMKIVIKDDGKGFNLTKPISKLALENKLGLLGMQERAKLLSGTFEIFSHPGEGTTVSLEFKLGPYLEGTDLTANNS